MPHQIAVVFVLLATLTLAGCFTRTAPVDVWVEKADGTPYAGADVSLKKMQIFGGHSADGRTDTAGHETLDAAVDGPLLIVVADLYAGTWSADIPHPSTHEPVDWIWIERYGRPEQRIRVRMELASGRPK